MASHKDCCILASQWFAFKNWGLRSSTTAPKLKDFPAKSVQLTKHFGPLLGRKELNCSKKARILKKQSRLKFSVSHKFWALMVFTRRQFVTSPPIPQVVTKSCILPGKARDKAQKPPKLGKYTLPRKWTDNRFWHFFGGCGQGSEFGGYSRTWLSELPWPSKTLLLSKKAREHPKRARVGEPLILKKSLENDKTLGKEGKTHKKARKIGKQKKQENRRKQGLEGQG